MRKIDLLEYETDTESKRRKLHKEICCEYLERSNVILSGEVAPHRILSFLAERHNRSIMGIKHILKQAGIYRDAKHPVVFSGNGKPQQAMIGF
jgi:hypothetical protein